MLTSQQCRMARAALNIGVRELADAADVSPNTIARLERGEALHRRTLAHVQGALEAQGVAFLTPEVGGVWPGPVVAYAPGRRLTGRAKLFSDLWNLPHFHHDASAAFSSLLNIFEAYLDIIQHENREPDPWERYQLNHAVNALAKSDIFSAYTGIFCGIAPPDQQSREYRHPDDDAEAYKDLTMAYFRRAVSYIRTKGYAERYPEVAVSDRVTGLATRSAGAAPRGRKLENVIEEGHRLVAEAPSNIPRRPGLAQLMKSGRGVVASGVPDLASNPEHLKGFGRDAGHR